MRDQVPLDRLGHSFKRMDEMESKAEATYKMVLDRYPTNNKLLRSYGKFLESIKVRCALVAPGLACRPCARQMPTTSRLLCAVGLAERPMGCGALLRRGGEAGGGGGKQGSRHPGGCLH
jgi:hypothetical protein